MQEIVMDPAEDSTVINAGKEAITSGRITPLLKVELWAKIQSRRLSEGKEELKVEFKPPTIPIAALTEEEERKAVQRRESNRVAARKCRRKKKQGKQNLQMILEELQEKNRELKDKVAAMESEKLMLMEALKLPPACFSQSLEQEFEKAPEEEVEEVLPPIPFEDDDEDELSEIYFRSSQEVPNAQALPEPQTSFSAAYTTTPYSEMSVEDGDIDSWIGTSFISLDKYIP